MAVRLRLESFDFAAPRFETPSTPVMDEGAVEEVRLSAYEKGYAAGWDDSVAAQGDDQMRIREDLVRNLNDLSFTYQEARSTLLRNLEPLLRGMVDRILPEIVRETIGVSVMAEVMAEADRLASVPVEIVVAPVNRAAIEAAAGSIEVLPIRIVEDPTLAGGQVHLRFGEEERALDLDALVASIRSLVTQFLEAPTEERLAAHG